MKRVYFDVGGPVAPAYTFARYALARGTSDEAEAVQRSIARTTGLNVWPWRWDSTAGDRSYNRFQGTLCYCNRYGSYTVVGEIWATVYTTE